MDEDEGVPRQLLERQVDYVARPHQLGRGVPDRPVRLQARLPQPVIGQMEELAAVVVLPIVQAHGPAVPAQRDVLGHAIGHAGQQLSQVQGGVGVVADAQQ